MDHPAPRYGWHEDDVLVTVLDADSFLDPQFLPHVAYAFCTRPPVTVRLYTAHSSVIVFAHVCTQLTAA